MLYTSYYDGKNSYFLFCQNDTTSDLTEVDDHDEVDGGKKNRKSGKDKVT